ncbi:MAG: hypothetical protein P4L31_01705 [Candidatus Babeliales bacterium]|nr:hypothetical protein [Candidatus Babeliales bacterium]
MKNNKMLLLLTCAGLVAMQQSQAGWVDVTNKVKGFNGNSFTADTTTFGDPAPYIGKKLEITGKALINEHGQVSGFFAQNIATATYGAYDVNTNAMLPNKSVDVTSIVKSLLLNGSPFKAENDALNVKDPAYGTVKTLEITFNNGKEVYNENSTVPAAIRTVSSARFGADQPAPPAPQVYPNYGCGLGCPFNKVCLPAYNPGYTSLIGYSCQDWGSVPAP